MVDGIARLVDVARHEDKRHRKGDHDDGQSDQEHRAPPEMLEQRARLGGPSRAVAPPMPDHSAIALVRAGPDQSAVISSSVVGKAMPAATPPSKRAATSSSA